MATAYCCWLSFAVVIVLSAVWEDPQTAMTRFKTNKRWANRLN